MAVFYSQIHVVNLESESEFWGDTGDSVLFILRGEGNRSWLEGHYPLTSKFGEHCSKKTLVPEGPDDPNMLLDGCLVFLTEIFSECEHYSELEKIVNSSDFIDLDLNKPEGWDTMRKECVGYMGRLDVKTISLVPED